MTGDPFLGPGFALEARDGDRVRAGYLDLDTERPVIVAENRIGGAVVRMLVVHARNMPSLMADENRLPSLQRGAWESPARAHSGNRRSAQVFL
jgi:hypothetical protein